MKPIDKANDLIDRFRMVLMNEDTECGNEILCTIIAKQNALIAVEFAREFITGDLSEKFDKILYLIDIKEEIEKI